jgi:hypothetical protein
MQNKTSGYFSSKAECVYYILILYKTKKGEEYVANEYYRIHNLAVRQKVYNIARR